MKPEFLVRSDDFEVFSLNDNGKTYSSMKMKEDFPGHCHNEYSPECLLSHGFFEGVEDDFAFYAIQQEKYQKSLPRSNGMDD